MVLHPDDQHHYHSHDDNSTGELAVLYSAFTIYNLVFIINDLYCTMKDTLCCIKGLVDPKGRKGAE